MATRWLVAWILKMLWLRQGDMMALHRVLLIGAIFKTFTAAVFVLLFHPFIFIFFLCLLKQAISKINNAPQYHNTYYRVHYIAIISKNLVSSFTLEVSPDYHFQQPQMPKCTEKSSFLKLSPVCMLSVWTLNLLSADLFSSFPFNV